MKDYKPIYIVEIKTDGHPIIYPNEKETWSETGYAITGHMQHNPTDLNKWHPIKESFTDLWKAGERATALMVELEAKGWINPHVRVIQEMFKCSTTK